MEYAIRVKGLTKTYGPNIVLKDFDLTVKKGEIVGLLGHNGAGKSTALECMLGIRKPDAGEAIIEGRNPVLERKEMFQRVGVQFQETSFPDKIRVGEACRLAYSLYRNPRDWSELLKIFGLDGMVNRLVAELSGGERQRLSVLIALIPRPDLVFLDELTTGLDPAARVSVWKYLQELKRQGISILLTSHFMDEVEALCDRVCILQKGAILVEGTLDEVVSGSGCRNMAEAYLWYTGREEWTDESLQNAVGN